MKSSKDIDNEKEKDFENGQTDKDLIEELIKSDDEDDNNEENSYKVKDVEDQDFVEVDGVKTISFSLKKELKEGYFDKNGNYRQNEESDNEDDHDYSEETSDYEVKDTGKVLLQRLKQILELIPPQKNAAEALQACGKDEKRLIALTDCATDIMSLGHPTIYTDTIEKIQEYFDEIQNAKE
ncbi:hypothetical protein TRFO_17122 [Tritrichomonas foetus]|uniref:Uncharacterized protein n=1 Tax=Tritrichomonas foetus TaxID=1144522 RepID=A0A1J4KNH6_9EUKA|nr:hypothetical protein TRFO_17122 [Tritrichomonas foetus]|eukprot:OHT12865.1 hypothetical protein TRFO_17122 [Tritrichomonas foetus]